MSGCSLRGEHPPTSTVPGLARREAPATSTGDGLARREATGLDDATTSRMASKNNQSFPLAYHITLHTYGSWVPGDSRGWHRRGDGPRSIARPGVAALEGYARELQRDPTVVLTASMSRAIIDSITTLSRTRGWRLYAAATVASHLHAVVGAPLMAVPLIQEIREESVRCLGGQGLCDDSRRFWSQGGHFSTIHTMAQLGHAVEYVHRHRSHDSA